MDNEAIAIAAQQDPLTFGIAHIDLLQGRLWQVDSRAWIKDIYAAVNPWNIEHDPIGKARQLVLMKGTQVGMTTAAAVKMFHFAVNWPVRVIYMLPRQQDYLDFVNTRVDPMIEASDILRSNLGTPDSTRAKRIADSYLFFMESTVEPRMMPADALMVDEVDLSDPANVSTALNRLDDSNWKLRYYFSTPTLPNYGIHGRYLLSDRRVWMNKCPDCGEWQLIDWETNLRVIGSHEEPDDVFFGCLKCNHRFTLDEIQLGQWVAEKPSRSEESIGFHISQIMGHPAEELYKHYTDPEQTITEFYRKRLGKPYERAGGSVSREDFLTTCFSEPYMPEIAHDSRSRYYMGVDQGNELQVVIAKIEPETRSPKIVKIELIPWENPDTGMEGWDRVAKLMDLFKVRRAVIDADPNRHSVRALQNKKPGRVIMADYTNIKQRYQYSKERNVINHVNINRSEALDDLMDSIREGYWSLYGEPNLLSPEVESLISHVTSLKRDIEERRTAGGVKKVVVWRRLRPDHLAHSMLYLKIAAEIDTGFHHKIAIIGIKQPEEEDASPEEPLTYWPKPDTIAAIVPKLAEVPQEQAQTYFNRKMGQGDAFDPENLPMPLRYKFRLLIQEKFSLEDIEWVLSRIASFGNQPIPTTPAEEDRLKVRDQKQFYSKNQIRLG